MVLDPSPLPLRYLPDIQPYGKLIFWKKKMHLVSPGCFRNMIHISKKYHFFRIAYRQYDSDSSSNISLIFWPKKFEWYISMIYWQYESYFQTMWVLDIAYCEYECDISSTMSLLSSKKNTSLIFPWNIGDMSHVSKRHEFSVLPIWVWYFQH